MEAGRIMLARLDDLESQRKSFAFESTLASRTLARRLVRMRGLSAYQDAPVEDIRGATRRAVENLVDTAISHEVDLVVIAGDVFDGDWKDYSTGLFWIAQLSRLEAVGIPVVFVAGNHDAASEISRKLRLPPNVTQLSSTKPETKRFDHLDVAVVGQSYRTRLPLRPSRRPSRRLVRETPADASPVAIVADYPDWQDLAPDAEALRAAADADKRVFLAALDTAETARDAAQVALNAASQQRGTVEVRIEEADRRKRSLDAKLLQLTNDGKSEGERESELKGILLAWEAAGAGLEKIAAKLAEFGDDPGAAVTTLEKQLQAADDTATKALEQEKTEEGRLMHAAAQGPYSALGRAEEEVARLKREIASEELRLAAIRLLRTTVEESRNAALAAVAAPVEIAATRTLQRIAGNRLGRVQLGEAFEPTQVLPGVAGVPVSIENTSGGEREQIYLATRLALADVLAKGERQLVVLDDVLVATDAGRLARVMGILEEAGQRLQVLILTCHPERYRGLDGAHFFDLDGILSAR